MEFSLNDAILGMHVQWVFDALAKEAMIKIQNFNSQEIANLAWSFILIEHFDNELFEVINEQINKTAKNFSDIYDLRQLTITNKLAEPIKKDLVLLVQILKSGEIKNKIQCDNLKRRD